ncbi:germinal-center associated nuclear protein [Salarias fasciatus]|uniref:Germinal-center associated nuclear protein n=1 Tax=Salarias fasciatus TaxID=181472 RepID=A0A672HIV6_SALFA|nr:germinal-center associated nuclear protein [Salarias fasciatus]
MNPSNPFGSPQGGAFQAPSGTMKTGLFQSFGQQSAPSQTQSMGFFQPSAFGQPSAMNQPAPVGTNMFGQAPAFGQSAAQPPAFGQTSLGMSNSAFGATTKPAFGQTGSSTQSSAFGQVGGSNQSSAFGQTGGSTQTSVFGQTSTMGQSAFGQTSGFTQQAPVFGKQPPAFGQQPSGFGNTQMTSSSTPALGQPQPLAFGQPVFGPPSSTAVSTGMFGAAQTVTQSRGFGSSEFSFKPATEAVFKPIFSASPEPANPQTTSLSSSPFGGTGSQTGIMSSGSTTSSTTTFSVLAGAKSGPLGFSFSQPAAAPSISSQSNPLTTSDTSGPTNTLQFTFSQPAAPSSSGTKASTTEPTTPSSFSFTSKTLQTQPAPLFGGSSFPQPVFGDIKAKADTSTDDKASGHSGLADTNVFARLSNASKRKNDMAVSGSERPTVEDDLPPEVDSPRHPKKRPPLTRTRGPPAGLFGRALIGIRKDGGTAVRKEAKKATQQQVPKWEETEREEVQAQDDEVTATPPAVPTLSKEPEQKQESEPAGTSAPAAETATPERRGVRRQSSESLSGLSPSDCTTIMCRNVPPAFNKKEIIEKHFGRFGKVHKVYCRPPKNLAIVHFNDHASAAKAKKKGKMLHKQELLLLWQRKKQSPGQKEQKFAEETVQTEEESQEDIEPKAAASPLKRPPPLRPSLLDNPAAFSHGSPLKRPLLVKSLQFDTEPQRDAGTAEPENLEHPLPSSLHHLVGQVAETTEDKYRLLEQRDKVLRQGRPKRTDLDMSKVIVGTCPDMCPEKERYMRETRKQLSIYEVIPGTELVDHVTAIKEYSRSSADQEEPLPHELRPLPMLCMTMDYLVTQIMDQGRENYRDWYDFVWNRTRSIRKDITQQRLCCPMTVSLIEKCTRFHVHCAHHLCEEHMSSFDAKINNENMTKCLQSLKEMYEDLAKRQVYCPQEAEFRQYSVLLKLNEGDILREVQQFRDEVRKSPEVKFAVQVFAAVNSNNFVRFFKLVKRASYLASCMLHRYFNQVRAKALKSLNIAHTVGPRSTMFPVEEIVRMLMFRDAVEAADFIQQYGLNVNDDMAELSRLSYQDPELPLSQKKSAVILVKKAVLVGEVVNGAPLPKPPQHVPVCSFDSHNRFFGQVPTAEPPSYFPAAAERVERSAAPSVALLHQVAPAEPLEPPPAYRPPAAVTEETGEPAEAYQPPAPPGDPQQLFQPISQPQPVRPPSPPPKPKPAYSEEEIQAELDGVIGEVVDAAVREVADAGAGYAAAALVEGSQQVESLLGEVLGQMVQEVSSTEIKVEQERVAEEKRKLEEARRKKEHEAFLTDFTFSLCTSIVDEVVNESVKETASSEIQQAVSEKAERVAKCTEQVCSSLVEETLNADIAVLVEDVLEAELQRIHKYIKRWRDVVAVRRQLKRQMRGFPAAPCCVDPRFKLKALVPSAPAHPSMADLARGLVNLGNAGTLALSSTRLLKMRQAAIHQMRVHHFYQQLLEETVWAPLNLPALLTQHIPDPPERIFWKAVLLLPSEHEREASLADRILSDWLEVKFGGRSSEERKQQADGTMQTLCVSSSLQEHQQRTYTVHVSVKSSRGPLTADGLSKVEEGCELQGASALVILLPALPAAEPGQEEQDVPLLSALLQLKQLQQASAGHCPLPLVILVPGPDGGAAESRKLEEALKLETLVKEGLISEYTFFFISETTSDLQGTKQLNQAMSWLLARAPPPFQLSCQTLLQLVEGCLTQVFIPRVAADCQDRVEASLPSQDAAPIIQFYNSLLAHVAEQVSSKELCKLSWPPGEFCGTESLGFVPPLFWNSAEHLAWLQEAILSLQLPAWEPPSEAASWSEVCSSIFNYVDRVGVSPGSRPLLISHLENLLQRVRLKAWRPHAARPKRGEVHGVGGAYRTIPWESVVGIFMDYKLKDWRPPGPPVCEDALTEDGEILVYFITDMLKDFQPPEEWIQAVNKTHRETHLEQDGSSAAASYTPSSQQLRQRLFHSGLELLEAPAAGPMDITHTATAQELLAHRVLEDLEEEKAKSQRWMEQLQRWLNGEAADHLSTPLLIPSSNILCMPLTIRTPSTAKTRDTPDTVEPEPEEPPEAAARQTTLPAPISWRLEELQQQIASSQEEEMACRLKLSSLMSIVDD